MSDNAEEALGSAQTAMQAEMLSLDKARGVWQQAKAFAKAAKSKEIQDCVKAFKGDLGPSLDGMRKAIEASKKAVAAYEAQITAERNKAVQTLASYKAAIEVRKLQTTPEGAKLMEALNAIGKML